MRRAQSIPYRWPEVRRVWRANRSLSAASLRAYGYWVHRFAAYCDVHGLEQRAELTQAGAARFARWWCSRGSHRNGQFAGTLARSHSALRALAYALSTVGERLPAWRARRPAPAPDPEWVPFADYLRAVRGSPPATIHKKITQLTAFRQFRRRRGSAARPIRLADVDAYIVACRRRYARTTVADICSALRTYLRFLYASGRLEADVAHGVMAPVVRVAERPHRALPWNDVQRLLAAPDRSTPCGRRDYALLLMMSLYGLGAGEVIGLSLDDIDWRAATVRIVRPKTRVVFQLPLLPSVARALVDYLKHGRPPHTSARSLFVSARTPFARLAGSTAVRHILHRAARQAGVTAPFLGTHVLRHTHACRQLELGTVPKVIGDILGHRDPDSTSAYLRVATARLRELSLPVPP